MALCSAQGSFYHSFQFCGGDLNISDSQMLLITVLNKTTTNPTEHQFGVTRSLSIAQNHFMKSIPLKPQTVLQSTLKAATMMTSNPANKGCNSRDKKGRQDLGKLSKL